MMDFMFDDKQKEQLIQARQRMVKHDLMGRDITDSKVLAAMSVVRREEFMPEKYRSRAYTDEPVPIGMGQTISQPYIVALMTQYLKVNNTCEVLEIGTGSGYQTAVLAKLAQWVYTVEALPPLAEGAQTVLGRLNIDNVSFCVGDGSAGWPEKRTFDRIIVTAAVPTIPQPLIEQLSTGGRMVIPVGGEHLQKLVLCEKKPVGIVENAFCNVRFVKLIGEYGFNA